MGLPRQMQALISKEARALRDRSLQVDIIDIAKAAERVLLSRTSRVFHQLVVVLLAVCDGAQRDRGARLLQHGITPSESCATKEEKTYHDPGSKQALGIALVPGQVGGDRERTGALSPAMVDSTHELK